jgi:hypothetical protein
MSGLIWKKEESAEPYRDEHEWQKNKLSVNPWSLATE